MWRRGSRGEMACEMASMCVFSLSLPRFRSCSLFFLFVCLFYLFFFSPIRFFSCDLAETETKTRCVCTDGATVRVRICESGEGKRDAQNRAEEGGNRHVKTRFAVPVVPATKKKKKHIYKVHIYTYIYKVLIYLFFFL